MTKTRLEAFSDGVIAIIITIMVLELKAPHETTWEAIKPLLPTLGSYAISFVFVGVYWGNHHHLLHTIKHINSKIIWANLHLLFWLSLIPFATAWMGEQSFSSKVVAIYCGLHILVGFSYYILLLCIKATIPPHSSMHEVLEKQSRKGVASLVLYCCGLTTAMFNLSYISICIIAVIAIIWWIPDRNIEKVLREKE